MAHNNHHFVVCINNADYPASLEPRKIYEVIDDPASAKLNQIRVIDESGEDYLYPTELFVAIDLPDTLEAAITGGA